MEKSCRKCAPKVRPRPLLNLKVRYIEKRSSCREREPEHVMKKAYIEELKMCPEKHRVYHVTESLYLPSRLMLHNFEETK